MKNMLQTRSARMIIWVLVITSFATLWFPPDGSAMLAPAVFEQESHSGLSRAEDMQKVQLVLENKLVQQRLESMGLSRQEVNTRLSKLSNEQLHQMAAQIDAQMPGGDAGLSIVITILVIAILVVLFIYILHRA